ncbi:MAG: hypothetical protein SPG09_08395, partial [Lachnospiraceae bacterium]|nr:hypothetical protein [Lachnospiraceae bacterium]
MKKRSKQILLLISAAGMMLSLCGCAGTRARETEELVETLAVSMVEVQSAGEYEQKLISDQSEVEKEASEPVPELLVESHTPQGVEKDVLNRAVNAILAANREFLGGYPMDESFLFWFRSLYGEDALEQVSEAALTGADADIWYQVSGCSIHVLWLDYCEQYGMHSEQLLRVTRQECATPDETVISFTGDMNFDDRTGTMQHLKRNGLGAALS